MPSLWINVWVHWVYDTQVESFDPSCEQVCSPYSPTLPIQKGLIMSLYCSVGIFDTKGKVQRNNENDGNAQIIYQIKPWMPPAWSGHEKVHFPWEYSHISHHFLCISLSLCEKSKFLSKLSDYLFPCHEYHIANARLPCCCPENILYVLPSHQAQVHVVVVVGIYKVFIFHFHVWRFSFYEAFKDKIICVSLFND